GAVRSLRTAARAARIAALELRGTANDIQHIADRGRAGIYARIGELASIFPSIFSPKEFKNVNFSAYRDTGVSADYIEPPTNNSAASRRKRCRKIGQLLPLLRRKIEGVRTRGELLLNP